MPDVPKLLADWVSPCPQCGGTGNHLPEADGFLACWECEGRGFVLNDDGRAAFDVLYRMTKSELVRDGFVTAEPD